MKVDAGAQAHDILHHRSQQQAARLDRAAHALNIRNLYAAARRSGELDGGDSGRGLGDVQLRMRDEAAVIDGVDGRVARELAQRAGGEPGADGRRQLVGARLGVECAHPCDDGCDEGAQLFGARVCDAGIQLVDLSRRQGFCACFGAVPASLRRVAYPEGDGVQVQFAAVDAVCQGRVERAELESLLRCLCGRQRLRIRRLQPVIDRDGMKQSFGIGDLERLNGPIQRRVVRRGDCLHFQRFGVHAKLLADGCECYPGGVGVVCGFRCGRRGAGDGQGYRHGYRRADDRSIPGWHCCFLPDCHSFTE